MDAAEMTLPIATTTISVIEPTTSSTEDPLGEGYDEEVDGNVDHHDETTKATGVRAVISAGGARGRNVGGDSEEATFSLVCDPTDLTFSDIVVDEMTGQRYEVAWAVETPGVAGLGHMQAGITTSKGHTP